MQYSVTVNLDWAQIMSQHINRY